MITIVLLIIILLKVVPKTHTHHVKSVNLNLSQQPMVCSTSYTKERTKQDPKSVHVASRTNVYYLNETKSINAQVKFPSICVEMPFPFVFCCVCTEERSRSISFVSSR